MDSLVKVKIIQNHIALITLNRPKAANSLSIALLDELNKAMQKINEQSDIYCSIITGAGEKAFCAGADLKERKNMSDSEVVQTVRHIGETVNNLEKLKMPVIAAINGVAFGGGLELALASDFRYIAESALVGLTETSLAIIPGAGGTQRLARLVGTGRAKEMIYTAARVTATDALDARLVEAVFPAENLLEEALKTAAIIASNGPIALKQTKLAINQGINVSLSEGLVIEHQCYKQTIQTNDRLEGLQAFSEKRKPVYKGN